MFFGQRCPGRPTITRRPKDDGVLEAQLVTVVTATGAEMRQIAWAADAGTRDASCRGGQALSSEGACPRHIK